MNIVGTHKKAISISVNVENVVTELKNHTPDIPRLTNNNKTNLLLIRSIAISNWLILSNNQEDKKLGASLSTMYQLPIKKMRELISISVWSGNWDKVEWMGMKAIPLIKERQKEKKARLVISLIKRKRILLFLFPLLLVLSNDNP